MTAERALAINPYSEQAHRLALAAALRTHDQQRVRVLTDRALAMLEELGVEPEPATQILLRRVDERAKGLRRLLHRLARRSAQLCHRQQHLHQRTWRMRR